eukprot:SAG31_NODE_24969_length_470_cov_5.935310_1_plen_75_part_01
MCGCCGGGCCGGGCCGGCCRPGGDVEDGRGDGEYHEKRVQLDCGKSPYPCVENGKSGPDHGLGERVRRDRPHSDG